MQWNVEPILIHTHDIHAGTDAFPTLPAPSFPSTFEFTKRKRWADLLITELTEAIILILSTRCQILYCSAAVRELIGWRDEDLIDTEFLDLVNGTWICPVSSFLLSWLTTGPSPQFMTARTLRNL